MSTHSSFTTTFIKRPVLSTVISLFIVMFGIISYTKLAVREFPKIHATAVNIRTTFPGADAKLMESFVTNPLEKSIATVEGLDTLSSSSSQNSCTIQANFQLGYDLNVALNDINGRISSVRWRLPKDINDPVIEKNDPNARPTMYIGFFSDHIKPSTITEYLMDAVQPRLETLPGVGEAKLFGEREYAMRIWLNPKKLAAYQITLSDVRHALERNNVRIPAGTLNSKSSQFNVSFKGDLETEKQFNDLIISTRNNKLIRIKDIGYAKLGVKDDDFSVNIEGKKGIVIGIIPKINANPLSVAQYVRSVLKKIKLALPQGLSSYTLWDSSIFIEKSIEEVKKTLFETAFFVIVVMFLFLGSFRVLLVPAIVIPISLIGAFGLMWLMGFTINTLTLLAMVLAIGMVVDDAIVVVENIYRHLEKGESIMDAAIIGVREIRMAVISMTLTLAAVYAPIGFTTGLSGILFKEFAFSLAGAVILSGIVALTLSPMMCTRVMSAETLQKPLPQRIHGFFSKLSHAYKTLLTFILRRLRWGVVAVGLLSLAITYALFMMIPKELGPAEDIGLVLSVIQGPASANIQFTEKNTQKLAEIFNQVPEKLVYGIINGYPSGPNSAMAFLALKPWKKRKRSINQVIYSMMGPMLSLPGVLAFPINPYSLPGQVGTFPIEIILKSPGSHQQLHQVLQKFLAAMHKIPFLTNIDTSLKLDKPEFDVNIHRNLAGMLGISMGDVGDALSLALGEPLFNRFVINDRSYYVIPQLDVPYQKTPDSIKHLYLRSQSGQLVPLSSFTTIKEVTRARSLSHFQQMNSATVTASTFPPGLPISLALKEIDKAAQKVLPKDVSYDFGGKTREFVKNRGTMLSLFLYAMLFIYLTLSAQFESFRDPLIVITTVPLSTLGALIALYLTGGTINVYTNIGLVTLIGLISKHGILMVEFANQLREKGLPKLDAIVQSATTRLRPILMTTLAMILGAFPLALAAGAGAVSRQQIGWAIVGGMSIGTLFSLFVIPAFYLTLS